jgi:uncharacterized protein YdcH (DUF465 family)
MELSDRLLVERFGPQNQELQSLIESHQKFEDEIASITGLARMTPSEQQHLRVLKKQKLRGRDRIEEILRGYRSEAIQS